MSVARAIGPVIIQLPKELVVTLEVFWREQFTPSGDETVTLRTLQEMAERGDLPGAFRRGRSRIWWINKLAMVQEGLQSSNGREPSKAAKEAPTLGPEEGSGRCPENRKRVSRKKAKEGVPAPLRYNS